MPGDDQCSLRIKIEPAILPQNYRIRLLRKGKFLPQKNTGFRLQCHESEDLFSVTLNDKINTSVAKITKSVEEDYGRICGRITQIMKTFWYLKQVVQKIQIISEGGRILSIFHHPVHIAVSILLLDALALIIHLFPAAQANFEFGKAPVINKELQGNNGKPRFLHLLLPAL